MGSWYVGARIGCWCVEVGEGSDGARVHGAVHQYALGGTDLCRLKNVVVFFAVAILAQVLVALNPPSPLFEASVA